MAEDGFGEEDLGINVVVPDRMDVVENGEDDFQGGQAIRCQ